MIKRAILALTMLVAATVAHAAGTVPGFNLTPQFDKFGKVMPGCRLYVYQAGTVATPQVAYQDSALTIPSPGGSQLSCDASGRLPQWFVADGLIKLRLTTSAGTEVFAGDNLLVVGPSSGGGGGGGTVDPTTILQTGALQVYYGTGSRAGYVRANGRTIGSATSGATERANADTQALFGHLWNSDGNLAVSGGRGASALADWAANKTIATPDWSGKALAGLDDMGAGARGVLTSTYFGADPTVLGAAKATQTYTLTNAQMPVHNHGGVTGQMNTNQTHSHGYTTHAGSPANVGGDYTAQNLGLAQGATTTTVNLDHIHSIQWDGGGQPFGVLGPMKLATIYLKL